MALDRDEILARIDLELLFQEEVGVGRGHGRAATWPCPVATHEQTGKSPPVSINVDKQVWRCHACGTGGSAVDLLMHSRGLSAGAALGLLEERAGLAPSGTPPPRARQQRATAVPQQHEAPSGESSLAVLEHYVAACAAALWRPEGRPVLEWLAARGLGDDVLRANRIGADPGPRDLERADGLPRRGVGAVFPVLGADGRATYCQTRYLRAGRAKYDNPVQAQFGSNPRVALLQPPKDADDAVVVVCEGMPDALTAAGAGARAIAVLGAGYPDAAVAKMVLAAQPRGRIVVAFDADQRGRQGASQLGALLAEAGAGRRVHQLGLPVMGGEQEDVNSWAVRAGSDFAAQFRSALAAAAPLGWELVTSAADLLSEFLAAQADIAGAVKIPTGVPALDELLAHGGWRPGVVLLGGLAGVGKSAFALHTAVHAALAGHPVLYVSVEQSPLELLGRLFCKELARPIADYWNRSPSYLDEARQVAGRLPLANLYLRADPALSTDHDGTVGRVRAWAAAVADLTAATPLVVVDYLQRMRPPEAERRLDVYRQISLAGLGLRQLARDLTCPVIAISSLGRASYDKAVSLDCFKGSGDLEYDADACMVLRVAARNDDEARSITTTRAVVPLELHIVGKNRYGPLTGEHPLLLDFDRSHGAFRSQRQHEPAQRGTADNGRTPPKPPSLDLPDP